MSRRKPLTSDAALATGVDYLLREFKGLSNVPTSTVVGDQTTFTGPIESTYLVASSTARESIRAVADFVCDGVADNDEINSAVELCGSLGGGTVQLTEGTFNIEPTDEFIPAIEIPDNVSLVGVGSGTVLSLHTNMDYQFHVRMLEFSHLMDLSVDMSNVTNNDIVGIDVASNWSTVQRVWFHGMPHHSSGLTGLVYIVASNRTTIIGCRFFNGTISAGCMSIAPQGALWVIMGCFFNGNGTHVDTSWNGDGFTMVGCVLDSGHVKVGDAGGSSDSVWIMDTLFDGTTLAFMAAGTRGLVHIGNCSFRGGSIGFEGVAGFHNIELMGSTLEDTHIYVQDNVFIESFMVSGCHMFGDTQIAMDSAVGPTAINRIVFTGNTLNSVGGDQHWGPIQLGGTGTAIGEVLIAGNNFDIDVQASSTYDSAAIKLDVASGGAPLGDIRIADNVINDYSGETAATGRYGIEVVGHGTPLHTVIVENNTIRGGRGVWVSGMRSAVVANNTLPFTEKATAVLWEREGGQVAIDVSEFAHVTGNVVNGGNGGDQTGKGAVLYVKALVGGSVLNNDITGHDIATLDTAIEVEGPLHIAGNQYLGAGPRLGTSETPFSNELVVVGTGATVGDNPMTVDVSGATTPTFVRIEQVVWTMGGVLALKTGLLRIPFNENVEIIEVEAMVAAAPTGTTVIVDVHMDGVTLYTTQASRPTVALAAFANTTVPDITAVAAGSYLTVDVDQIDSNAIATDLSVTVRYRRA